MRLFIVIILSLYSWVSAAQVINSVVVSSDTILIADEIRIFHKMQIPAGTRLLGIDYKPMVDGLKTPNIFTGEEQDADVDWSGQFSNYDEDIVPAAAIALSADGSYTDTLKLSIYQAGMFMIPNPRILLDTLAGNAEVMDMQSPVVVVKLTEHAKNFIASVGDSISPEKLKNGMVENVSVIKTEKVWQDYLWIAWILIPLLIGAAIAFYLLRLKKQEAEVLLEKPIAPAHYYAQKRLAKIEEEKLWKEGKDKQYQTDLTYSIREYLENRYEIQALESTTGEIRKSLSGQVSLDQETELLEILQIADLVKFAKAKPSEDINASFLSKAKNFVQKTCLPDDGFDEAEYHAQLEAYNKQAERRRRK